MNLGFETGKGKRLYQFGCVTNRAGGLVLTEIQGLVLSMAKHRTDSQIHKFIAELKNMHGLKSQGALSSHHRMLRDAGTPSSQQSHRNHPSLQTQP